MAAAPKRQLGLGITIAIVIANMIGTGVFTTTGFMAGALHDPTTILIAWVIGGLAALCGAACYAELGSMMPKAGGEYVYLREAYHPVAGFMSGWVSLTAGFSAPIAAAAIAFSKYLSVLIGGVGGTAQKLIAIALILAITSLHAFDTKLGGRVQAVFTALKVTLIAVFIFAGLLLGHGDWSHFASAGGGISANLPTKTFAIQLMWVSFSYSGWNAAAYIAGEVERPQVTLPRALLLGTGVVMALYLLLNVVYFYALPSSGLENVAEVGAAAADGLFGGTAAKLLTTLIALALISAVSAMVMAGPRVYASMAADGALPKRLAWHSARGVPAVAVAVQGGLAIVFVLIGTLSELIDFVGFTLTISAAITVCGLFIMRRRGLASTFRTFGYPVTPLAFIALSVWIAYARIDAYPRASGAVGLMLVIGAVVYVVLEHGRKIADLTARVEAVENKPPGVSPPPPPAES